MALHDKIKKALNTELLETVAEEARAVRSLARPATSVHANIADRAGRLVALGHRIEALEHACAIVHNETTRWNKADGIRLVVIAGPNHPEILTVDELPEVLSAFALDEVSLWARGNTGSLDLVTIQPTGSWRDDAFAYFTGELFLEVETDGPVGKRSVGTTSWSRKL